MQQNVLRHVGNTPVVKLPLNGQPNVQLYAKLECYNPTGSIKDRAAHYVLSECLSNGVIDQETMIIESSSGNFGVALAAYTDMFGLRFTCVVDPNIAPVNEFLLRSFNANIVKVETPDKFGNFLAARISKVNEIVNSTSNIYWINQYQNPLNAQAYYETIGGEICSEFGSLDYIFIGVSSGGTIAGLSQRMKKYYPGVQVIAVDSVGSMIFTNSPCKRYIPGMGSSMRPEILKQAIIDDKVLVRETDAVDMCYRMLRDYHLLTGGSSGAIMYAVNEFFRQNVPDREVNVMAIFPDKGEKYINTIYNKEWCERNWGATSAVVRETAVV
ncbi:2,3-diaminopropionate biosynthesis protein SbnA [Chitinophaga qingshengii]|uniref:N-(2-amino-2-carboxyethyl)-L-glutamate synthase n=1 Tax=Chitinophaga qingshengii TaxID=1569794 RepID=A0ABR7TFW8_9BACT|nr:2,3-diaminopropionate biosynthesis protein SbnA [Chitinophaga qingshengii]